MVALVTSQYYTRCLAFPIAAPEIVLPRHPDYVWGIYCNMTFGKDGEKCLTCTSKVGSSGLECGDVRRLVALCLVLGVYVVDIDPYKA